MPTDLELNFQAMGKLIVPDRAEERARLNEALEQASARATALAAELDEEKERVARLHAQLAGLDEEASATEPVPSVPVDKTATVRQPNEKLAIFRSLFRGRPDVYPTRFVSREGKQGYGPACANKFVKGKCELPRVKCGECTNQAFVPADDVAYLAHLRGDHVMGVYPMALGRVWAERLCRKRKRQRRLPLRWWR